MSLAEAEHISICSKLLQVMGSYEYQAYQEEFLVNFSDMCVDELEEILERVCC